jgi:hypothetical protein
MFRRFLEEADERLSWVNAGSIALDFSTNLDRYPASSRHPSATCLLTFTTDPTPLLSVDFPCGLLSLSPYSYIAGCFRLVDQSAATY